MVTIHIQHFIIFMIKSLNEGIDSTFSGVRYCSEIVPTLVEHNSYLDFHTCSAGHSYAV